MKIKWKSFLGLLLLSGKILWSSFSCAGDGSTLDPLGNPLTPSRIFIEPNQLILKVREGEVLKLKIKIKNSGGFPLIITHMASQQEWLHLQAVSVPLKIKAADSLMLSLTVGHRHLTTQTYMGAIRFQSNDQKQPIANLPITLKVTREKLLFEPRLENIQKFIFSTTCIECHAGAGAPKGLILSKGNSYDHLVNVNSVGNPQLLRVEPFKPQKSYLVKKLEGVSDISGGRMPPLNRAPLSKGQIQVIRRWIANGAMNN